MTTCRSCGASVPDQYCGQCGEKVLVPAHDLSIRALAGDALADLFNFDGRIWGSLRSLVTRPGELTLAWSEGRRTRYTKPLGLFVFVNLVFFLTLSAGFMRWGLGEFWQPGNDGSVADRIAAYLARTGESVALLRVRYAIASDDVKKTFLIGAVPVLACVLALVEAGRGRRFVEHVVFALHTWTWYLLWWGFSTRAVFFVLYQLVLGLRLVAPGAAEGMREALSTERALVLVILAAVLPWIARALQVVYAEPRWRAWAKALLLCAALQGTIIGFRPVVFILSLYKLGI